MKGVEEAIKNSGIATIKGIHENSLIHPVVNSTLRFFDKEDCKKKLSLFFLYDS